MKRWTFGFVGLVAALLTLFGCGSPSVGEGGSRQWIAENGQLKVLATTAIVHDLVSYIGGEAIDCIALITGSLDPHSYELVKGDDEKLAYADLIFASGLGLEHGPTLRRYLAQSDKAVSLGDRIAARSVEIPIFVEGQLDPHIWMDVMLWREAIPVVVEELSAHLPDQRSQFVERGAQLRVEMQQLHEEMLLELASVPPERRYLVTTHDAFNYFTRAYLATDEERECGGWSVRCEAPEGLAPEGQLSSLDIRSVVDHLHRFGVAVLFPESNQSRDSLRKIAEVGRELGMEVHIVEEPLYGDALGEPGSTGETYLSMMRHNARLIARSLR